MQPSIKEAESAPVARESEEIRVGVDLSVVVPIAERHDDLEELYRVYSSELERLGCSFEFVFVVDGKFKEAFKTLTTLKEKNPSIRIIRFERSFGEAVALSAGFDHSNGKRILTLSPYFQVEPEEVGKLIEALGQSDLAISRRHPRTDSWINRVQSALFHWITGRLTGVRYHDITCGLRAMSREVASDLNLYGDLHRFIPIMAHKQGFKVAEIPVRQHPMNRAARVHKPGVYLRRLLDIMTVFFLSKFTKKPLRFFGLIGSAVFISGSLVTGYLGIVRLFGSEGIADRPLLLLGVLLMVLGVQLLSIGLIGEIIIFAHARQIKDYRVQEILE
jgi:glycosyltransferase involved in cell wall biosynthesis